MKATEAILQFLVNASAAAAHILGSEGERPVSAWAWRLGSRSVQYGLLAIIIALPLFVAGPFSFGTLWTVCWAGCWACQIGVVVRRWWAAYRRARRV
jgi:hypothetical protein